MDDPCIDCGCDLVVEHIWRRLPRAYRRALIAHEISAHHGRGLCSRCYQRRRCGDTLIDVERRSLSRDELLDEWRFFAKDRDTYTQNVKAFAAHIGRNYKSVEKALTRAGVTADDIWSALDEAAS